MAESSRKTVYIVTPASECFYIQARGFDGKPDRSMPRWVAVGKRTSSHTIMLEFWYDSTSLEELSKWIVSVTSHPVRKVRGWWSNCHDHEGKMHYHVVVWFMSTIDLIQAVKWLIQTGCPLSNHSFSLWSDARTAVRYLRHQDDPDKYQYPSLLPAPFSIDQAEKWMDGLILRNPVAKGAPRSDRETVGIATLSEYIAENCIITWSALIATLTPIDAALLRCALDHSYITTRLLDEMSKHLHFLCESPINGTSSDNADV